MLIYSYFLQLFIAYLHTVLVFNVENKNQLV